MLKVYKVDAFTSKPFSGNPAGVCILKTPCEEGWMQSVAREMNLSETAFLCQMEDGSFNLRWFTPQSEVDLCGHATLASAFILWDYQYLDKNETARFNTLSGLLKASNQGEWIELDFPLEEAGETNPPKELLDALGVRPKYVGKNRMDYIVEVENEAVLKNLNPDLVLLSKVDTRGVIVTCTSDSKQYDFLSRFFAPRVGIDEDPVTGSAHCCLGPYWMKRLSKKSLTAYQASDRGGVVKVQVRDGRVILGGQAVVIMEGSVLV
ncbi:MAG: PhzF family phenazine biosynthesis protein [Clostridia bacterium]|nr:PhzF family phenazine biosynthesis protein [Clostridia bacterium]